MHRKRKRHSSALPTSPTQLDQFFTLGRTGYGSSSYRYDGPRNPASQVVSRRLLGISDIVGIIISAKITAKGTVDMA
jgi:hypothetical protein